MGLFSRKPQKKSTEGLSKKIKNETGYELRDKLLETLLNYIKPNSKVFGIIGFDYDSYLIFTDQYFLTVRKNGKILGEYSINEIDNIEYHQVFLKKEIIIEIRDNIYTFNKIADSETAEQVVNRVINQIQFNDYI
ncbi:hypothetical protein [Enterococcus faecium]|uniref:hypothetical protein n=1 Tax=Enterococcus faecium TaxID=1352 RepID=UPI00145A648F|nr:hypothetical protein [Enterococcus faecium]QMX56550.1 hypothetical protein HI838_014735 [Enterococcus faecium]QOJ75706.1 hypothetical protein IG632_14735 [Enterococcus faecium]QTQ92110.1 hypothetical protein J7155_14705 [Enterococcus faecium]HCR2865848.1 hypothetical protein [Enterococcus faecium]